MIKSKLIWHTLYIIDEACDAWTGFVEDVLNDFQDKTEDIFESVVGVIKGIVFAFVALPICAIGAMAHRLKRFCKQEQNLKKNWAEFYEWYKNNKRNK